MNFQIDKSKLENDFAVLKQQANQTNEAWEDSVQERFYEQFINPLPKGFNNFINALDKLDKLFDSTEHKISELQE